FRQQLSERLRNRFGKTDVGRNTIAEKSVLCSPAGSIVELRGEKHVTRRILLLQAADRGDANDPAHAQRTKGINVGPLISFVWKKAMATPVTWKKVNRAPREVASNDCIRRTTKRSMNFVLFWIAKAFDLIEAAPTDDANCRLVIPHAAAIIQKAKRL